MPTLQRSSNRKEHDPTIFLALSYISLTASFKYDALGRRIEKTINGVTTRYLYDGLDIIQEKNANGDKIALSSVADCHSGICKPSYVLKAMDLMMKIRCPFSSKYKSRKKKYLFRYRKQQQSK